MCSLDCVLWFVGAVVVARFLLWEVGRSLYKRLFRAPANLNRFGLKEGAWGIVTGASDGIGKSYALSLAKRGFNVCLISRTKSKLDELAEEIKSKYHVQVVVLPIDFSNPSTGIYEQIKNTIETKCEPVGILVNNVGVNYPYPRDYLDSDPKENEQIITVNINAVNEMTRIVLPKMVERKSGGIINLSSFSGRVPAPMLSVYSASKSYIHFFSLCLASEYARQGIAVQSVTPSMVVSNMSKVRRASTLQGVTVPSVISEGSLNTLGIEDHWSPFWVHALLEYLADLLPLSFMLGKINNMHRAIRKRAIAKEEREKK